MSKQRKSDGRAKQSKSKSDENRRDPIAIVGIGCRFPGGASDPESYWRILRDGVDAISEVPSDRWNVKKYYDPKPATPGKTNACRGGFVDHIDLFDAAFFGISPREATRMDPQQRVLLEVAWEAMEDAGLTVEKLSGSNTGVFVGLSSQDYMLIQQGDDLSTIDAHTNTGGAMSIVANRVSYCFNLLGPSIALDTACSSSLMAIHQACQSVWSGESAQALAGGVNILIKPEPYVGFSRLSMLSPDGQCRAFDASANGFVRSEGAGMIVLKPLSEAQADGDQIYAVVRSTATNQDGATQGLTVPSQPAQEELVREACRQAGVAPAEVQYVEAHGTGTLVGDPIEAGALGAVLAEGRKNGDYCRIGSVKTNIGHLEPAAGVAGVIKVALALKHGSIPPNLHFDKPNPEIPFEQLKLKVPTTLEPWPGDSTPLAGVNSFGFGGANAHALLEQAPPNGAAPRKKVAESGSHLVPFSARSSESLTSTAARLCEYLGHEGPGAGTSFEDLVWTATHRRSHHAQRLSVVASNREELLEQLQAFADGQVRAGVTSGRAPTDQQPRIAFVCSGQGPQWWAMGRELLAKEPVFRDVIETCDKVVRSLGPWSLFDELAADEDASRMQETSISQPAIFAIQVGLARLWESWGIRPDAVVGHSVGEVAAAHLAGVFDLETATSVIYHRGRCMDFADARGRMLAVGLPLVDAAKLVVGIEDKVSVAANNSPTAVTLSGDGAELERIAGELEERGVFNKFLRVHYAFHSPQMEPMKDELLEALADVKPERARLPLYSTVNGAPTDGTDLDAEYWWRNVRQSVLFADAIDGLLEEGYDVYLELSPHPVLAGSVTETALAQGKKIKALHSLRRGDDERQTMLKSLGALYTTGFDVNWATVGRVQGHRTALPTYAWQRESYWNESPRAKKKRIGAIDHPLLGERRDAAQPTWESKLDINIMRYLDDHRVQGAALLSGTSYLEMALAAAREQYGVGPYVIEEVELSKACFLPEKGACTVQLGLNPDEFGFSVSSTADGADADGEQSWNEHVRGKVRVYQGKAAKGGVDLDEIRRRCDQEIGADACYDRMGLMGLNYGPTFQGVERLFCGRDEALGEIRIPEGLKDSLGDYHLHPAVLDACFQVITGTLPVSEKKYGSNGTSVYLPVEFRRIRVFGRANGKLWSHARLVERNSRDLLAEVRVLDEQGNVVADIQGFKCQAIEGGSDAAQVDQLNDLVYRYEWQPRALAGAGPRPPIAAELPGPSRLCEVTAAAGRKFVDEYGLNEQRERLTSGINSLCSAFLLQAYKKLGVEFVLGERFTTEELNDRLGVASATHRRLMTRCLQMLDEDGILTHEGDKGEETWEVARVPEIGDPTEDWKAVFQANPGFYAELTLLGRCAPQLAEIFSGEVDPLQLIFPDGSLALAEHMYQDSLSLRFYNTLTQMAVGILVDALPQGRSIRVLEIGAGTGGLSSYVLSKLPADRTTYFYTDLSNHFFLKAQEKFADYPFIEYKRLDLEQDPLEQGFEPNSFDLVLASECVHATADLTESVTNIKKLLASDGLMLLLEAVEPVRWVDLVFGLTEGWWRFTDTDLRKDHPLLSFDQWKTLLEGCGFSDVQEASGGEGFENAVVIGRGPSVEQPKAQAAEEIDHEAGRWLIYADAGGHARALADLLEARGDKCTLVHAGGSLPANGSKRIEIDPASADDAKRIVDLVRADDGGPAYKGIVHMWSLDAPTIEDASVESLDQHMVTGCMSTIFLTQALTEVDAARAPRLWLVSRGAESVGKAPEKTAAVQSGLWGLGRVIMNEVPKVRTKLVDLDPAADDLSGLFDELWLDDEDDDAIAFRGAARYAHRYVRAGGRDTSAEARRLVRSDDERYRLETSRAGTFDKLLLRSYKRPDLAPGQVEIRVAAAGLNFADVMKALGLYPGLPEGPVPLGIECSGRISAVAADVTEFKPGDEVVAIAPFSFGSYVTARAMLVAPKPKRISFEEAATLPVAYLTTHYAMNYLGRMAPGEKVLVHSATGGVGLAAIQLAREAGAEVLATAGTPEKRDFLRSLGIEHVFDSRSLEFADEVLDATDGRGVDIVLNSLAGEGIRKGMNVLAPYGRFLEIGKRDIYANSKIGMRPFRKNLAFMAIDLDAAMRERPQLQADLFRELMRKLDAGTLGPLPFRVFPASNVAGAFRYMAQAKHIGKVLVSFQEPEVVAAPAAVGEMVFRDNATYLMTGGLGGFGLAVAQWMVEQGARNLVLMGRSGASSDQAREAVESMRAAGANIVVAKADVTNPEQTAKVIADIDASMPPLRGILHAAMVLKDRLLTDLNVERVRDIWAPKVYGAWNLHDLTKDRELDFFALFSSLASVFGTGGQGNYASANSFLDSFASHLRAIGRPAVTVSWGYVGEVGWVARHGETGERLEAQGVHPFSPRQALQLLGRFMQDGTVHVGVMNMDWRQWSEAALQVSSRFSILASESGDGGDARQQSSGSATRKALLAADSAERLSMMRELLTEQVARVLGAAPDKLDVERPLTDLGLDSLMAVELRNWVEGDLRLSLPTVELMRGPSVTRLAELLVGQLSEADSGTAASPVGEIRKAADDGQDADVEKLLAEVDDMPDEQVAALLAEMGSGSNEASR